MDYYDSDADSILIHLEALRSKWTGYDDKFKSLLFSLKESNAKNEEIKTELESYKKRAIKAENERDSLILIIKELYREKMSSNPFCELFNKLERIVLSSQKETVEKNFSKSSIGDIRPATATLTKSTDTSDPSRDNSEHSVVDVVSPKRPIVNLKTELTNTNTDSDSLIHHVDRLLIANGITIPISKEEDFANYQNSSLYLGSTSTPLNYPDQNEFPSEMLDQQENAQHGLISEFVELEPDSSGLISVMKNIEEDTDPLSLSDDDYCIPKKIQIKSTRSLLKENAQQGTFKTNSLNPKVSLPRINLSREFVKNSKSNNGPSEIIIQEQAGSSSAVLIKRSLHKCKTRKQSTIPDSWRSIPSKLSETCSNESISNEDVKYERGRRCLICKKGNSKSPIYATYQDLDEHILKNHPQPYPKYRRCPYGKGKCKRHFVELQDLRAHMKLHHENESSLVIRPSPTSRFSGYTMGRCYICDESFTRLLDLKKHLNQIHNGAYGPFKCQTCDSFLPTNKALYHHKSQGRCVRRITEKSSSSRIDSSQLSAYYKKCEICVKKNRQDETYYNRPDLDLHILQSHPNPHPEYLRCPHRNGECKRHFTSMDNYRKHASFYHREEDFCIPLEKFFPGQKRWTCSVCNKIFSSQFHLKRHTNSFCSQVNKTAIVLRKRHQKNNEHDENQGSEIRDA